MSQPVPLRALPAAEVLEWGTRARRDLPWRRSRDPWVVLVSEVMLQQTQVARVIPKLASFLDAYPTPSACAAAPLADILRRWHGLGYPRRARNLHLAAQAIDRRGSFPDTLDTLRELPGVGAYTARAVLAFAYEADSAVVDTNIARVLARWNGRRLTATAVQAAADASLPPGQAWAWNQSLMDLGAMVCRPVPHCATCPLADGCAWLAAGGVGSAVPDPAHGSAAVSTRQAPFNGSDRQARGRLLARLLDGAVDLDGVSAVVQRDRAAADALLDGLVADGLCVVDGTSVRLP